MKTVIIDNYDSFTYNLAHLVKELGAEVDVLRNDKFRLEELEPYDKIILSPGPGVPEEAGLLLNVIRTYAGRKPILGVCLGEQAIGQVFGGKLVNLEEVFHGVQTEIRIRSEGLGTREEGLGISDEGLGGKDYEGISLEEDYIFCGLPNRIPVGRYHSWVVDTKDFPKGNPFPLYGVPWKNFVLPQERKLQKTGGLFTHFPPRQRSGNYLSMN